MSQWRRWVTFGLFTVTVVLAYVLAVTSLNGYGRLSAWLLVAIGVVAVAIELAASQKPIAAVFVDERARYSQPALITMVWFVVVVSAYLACALWNLALWEPGSTPLPIEITVPPTVWVLAGIVGVDMIATGLIIANKKHHATHTPLFRRNDAPPKIVDFVGFDEEGIHELVDLTQVQKLLFQIAAVIVYAVALGKLIFMTPVTVEILRFPAIPEGFVALLGVSTAIAVANRAIPR